MRRTAPVHAQASRDVAREPTNEGLRLLRYRARTPAAPTFTRRGSRDP